MLLSDLTVKLARQDFVYAHGGQYGGRHQQRFHSDNVDIRYTTVRRDSVHFCGPIRSLVPYVRLRTHGQRRSLRLVGHVGLCAGLPLGFPESGEPLVVILVRRVTEILVFFFSKYNYSSSSPKITIICL